MWMSLHYLDISPCLLPFCLREGLLPFVFIYCMLARLVAFMEFPVFTSNLTKEALGQQMDTVIPGFTWVLGFEGRFLVFLGNCSIQCSSDHFIQCAVIILFLIPTHFS